jgi:hypothetical protein
MASLGSGSGPTAAPRADTAAREPAENVANVARARRFAVPGLLVWSATFVLDAIATKYVAPGRFVQLALVSVAGLIVIAGALLRLRARPPPSPRAWRLLMTGTFTALNVAFALMGVIAGGALSPYFGGALVVLAGFGVVVTLRWREGLVWAAPVAAAYPATQLVAAAWSPAMLAQLARPDSRFALQFDAVNLLALYAIVVAAGHVQWSLRKQVFEARSLGRYKLKKRIGAGGMGEVWVAYHDGLKRDVAVKILRDEGAPEESAQAVARFEREVRATAELTHPNTVRVYDYGVTDDGLCYYVMELLHGENLASLAAHDAPLPPARAIHLVAQAARALAEAHTRGIVHRDVKPENLVVTNAGGERDFVKVLDFGIAKLTAGRDEATAITRAGSVVGTPKWLAPEAFAGKPAEAPADVFALGAVLYLLLKGVPPIPGETLAEIAAAHARKTPAPLPESVPTDLAAVVERCLRKAPEERFPNAGALAEALAACADAGRWTATDARAAPERGAHVDGYGVTVAARKT